MNRNVIVSCAVTGSGDTVGKHPEIPVTPKEIATAAIEAAKAGAAIAHIHVREPDGGKASRRVELYSEVVERIRGSDVDVIINLTTGMGGDLYFGPDDEPMNFGDSTDCVGQMERIKHVEDLLPEICSLDCGSFNYSGGDYVYISTENMLKIGTKRLQEIGVKPELEVFELGHLSFAKYFKAMVDALPDGCNWGGFGIGATEMPMVAQAVLLGGNVRVGLEDNIYLEKGVFASNAQLVERACNIVQLMGCSVQTPAEARQTLGLKDAS